MKINRKLVLSLVVLLLAFSVIAATVISSTSAPITAGKTTTVPLGKAGATFVRAYYSGTVVLQRRDPNPYSHVGTTLTQNPLKVDFYNTKGDRQKIVLGPVYVYFNLGSRETRLWDKGQLSIFQWDSYTLTWKRCPTYEVTGKAKVRVACRIKSYGIYAVGY